MLSTNWTSSTFRVMNSRSSLWKKRHSSMKKNCAGWNPVTTATSNRVFTPKIIWTCNPGNVGHDYVKRVMLDREFSDNEQPGPNFDYLQGYGWDNVE